MQHKTVIALVVGLVVGFGSAWLWLARPGPSNMTNDEEVSTDELADADADGGGAEVGSQFVGENQVLVKDQEAGERVFISRVDLINAGWVAIHEGSAGVPGNVLGAARFDSGTYQGSVKLLKSTVSGSNYYAMLHSDDGDKEFMLGVDAPLTDVEGEIIVMEFAAY